MVLKSPCCGLKQKANVPKTDLVLGARGPPPGRGGDQDDATEAINPWDEPCVGLGSPARPISNMYMVQMGRLFWCREVGRYHHNCASHFDITSNTFKKQSDNKNT